MMPGHQKFNCLKYISLKREAEMSAFMCMQLVVLEEAGCAQEYAVLFLGFAGTV